MDRENPHGTARWRDAAERHGFSLDAVRSMARALEAGGGGMAQFDHPEFGGMGQWFSGGMLMLGTPNDHALKARVAALCEDLGGTGGSATGSRTHAWSSSHATGPATGPRWWPEELGSPSSTGAQNATRYAVFPESRRLAVETGGRVALYDTGERIITGVSQQQGGGASMRFTGPDGAVELAALRRVPTDGGSAPAGSDATRAPDYDPVPRGRDDGPDPPRTAASVAPSAPPSHGAVDPLTLLERLADLHRRGVLTEAEFTAKKTELLARL